MPNQGTLALARLPAGQYQDDARFIGEDGRRPQIRCENRQILPTFQGPRHFHGGCADIENDGFAFAQKRCQPPAYAAFGIGVAIFAQYVGRLVAERGDADGAAPRALQETFALQGFQVAANGHFRDIRELAQLGDGDASGRVQAAHDRRPPFAQAQLHAALGDAVCAVCVVDANIALVMYNIHTRDACSKKQQLC